MTLRTVILLISNWRRLAILFSTQCLYDCSSENGFPSSDNSDKTLHCERHLMSSKLNSKDFFKINNLQNNQQFFNYPAFPLIAFYRAFTLNTSVILLIFSLKNNRQYYG